MVHAQPSIRTIRVGRASPLSDIRNFRFLFEERLVRVARIKGGTTRKRP